MLFPTLVPEGMPLVVLESMSAGCPVVGYSFASGRDIASALRPHHRSGGRGR